MIATETEIRSNTIYTYIEHTDETNLETVLNLSGSIFPTVKKQILSYRTQLEFFHAFTLNIGLDLTVPRPSEIQSQLVGHTKLLPSEKSGPPFSGPLLLFIFFCGVQESVISFIDRELAS